MQNFVEVYKIEGARLSGGLLQRGVGEGCAVRQEMYSTRISTSVVGRQCVL